MSDIDKVFEDDNDLEKRLAASDLVEEHASLNNTELPDCLTCDKGALCCEECINFIGIDPFVIGEATTKIIKALKIAVDYGQEDGAHHKAYAIDQMVRALTDDQYDRFRKSVGSWDTGED
ncbi:MAG: hypothetical protein DRN81_01210 [Thermoproteota archaeon]|nr:MAG: hypothetical protein DRN81_01210 [Candidatus Korarchaeota archaeon]